MLNYSSGFSADAVCSYWMPAEGRYKDNARAS